MIRPEFNTDIEASTSGESKEESEFERQNRIVSKSTSSHLHAISNHLLSARLPLCLAAQFTHRAVVSNSGDFEDSKESKNRCANCGMNLQREDGITLRVRRQEITQKRQLMAKCNGCLKERVAARLQEICVNEEDMNSKEEETLETPNTSMQDMQRKAQKCLSTGGQIKSDKKQKALHLNAKLTGVAKEAKRSIGLSPQINTPGSNNKNKKKRRCSALEQMIKQEEERATDSSLHGFLNHFAM